jgi:hypothetical protein
MKDSIQRRHLRGIDESGRHFAFAEMTERISVRGPEEESGAARGPFRHPRNAARMADFQI